MDMLKPLVLATAASLAGVIAAEVQAAAWPITCDAGACTAARALNDARTGRPMATILIAAQKGAPGLRLGAVLPLGVALAPGARFVQGQDVVPLAFEVCFPDGCRAMAEAEAALAGRLTAGFDLQFFAPGHDGPVAVAVPAEGMAEAVAELRRQAEARP